MSGRNTQVSRIYAILQILDGAPQGLTVKEITDRVIDRGHEIKQRTVYRDLDLLAQSGFPLSSEEAGTDTNAIRWKLEKWTRVTEHFLLTAPELLALYLARGVLTPLKDTPFYADLESIFKKIEARLGSKNADYLNELSSELQFEPGPRWGLGIDPDLIETVRSCCAERHVLSVCYLSAHNGENRQRRLGPQYLYFARGSLYLVAEDLEESKIKVYAVPRMSGAKMLDEEYRGEMANPEDYFQGVFGIFKSDTPPVQIKIQFSSRISPFVKERRWHTSQRVVSRGDGSIIFSVDVTITPELIQWILGFGSDAYVIEPASLQTRIAEEAEKTRNLYPKKAA